MKVRYYICYLDKSGYYYVNSNGLLKKIIQPKSGFNSEEDALLYLEKALTAGKKITDSVYRIYEFTILKVYSIN